MPRKILQKGPVPFTNSQNMSCITKTVKVPLLPFSHLASPPSCSGAPSNPIFLTMLVVRCAGQSRHSLYPLPLYLINTISTAASAASVHRWRQNSRCAHPASPPPPLVRESEVLAPFKQWFMSRKNTHVDRIFDILRTQDDVDAALCRLDLRLTEPAVLEVLQRGNPRRDWLCCMKFFEWAERLNGFQHTPATCLAIFRILCRANQLEELEHCLNVMREMRYFQQIKFHSVLVSGYAMAGRGDFALTLYGRMRFLGLDLDSVSYHAFLNALVERGYFFAVDAVAGQIRKRGFENGITRAILVKHFCKRKEFDRAEEFLRHLMSKEDANASSNGIIMATLVDALCKDQQSKRADLLIKEVEEMGTVPVEQAKNVRMKNLIEAGDIDKALDFLKVVKQGGGFVPDVFRYNSLLQRLLSEDRLDEVYDLLTEMVERGVVPDSATMNATLFFFCKIGMMDAAFEMYSSRADFGFSVNAMSYNYLLSTALEYASFDDAYSLLRNAIERGILPGRTVFSVIASKEEKLDKMIELVTASFEKNFAIGLTVYDRFLFELLKSKKWNYGYELNEKFNVSGKVTCERAYTTLISGLIKAGEGPRAVKLVVEMQENDFEPDRKLFKAVICILCKMDNPEANFYKLFQRFPPTTCRTYNKFIDGAGHAGKYQLSREVYDTMERKGIQPDLKSDVLMLQSYVKNERTADALNFFCDLCMKREVKKKLGLVMVISLCRAKKLDSALEMFWQLRKNEQKLSIECYEELLKLLYTSRQYLLAHTYSHAIQIIDDLFSTGRRMSSFIGNILLVHAQKSFVLFECWIEQQDELSLRAESWKLVEIVKLMNDFTRPKIWEQDIVGMEDRIGRCFSLDSFTYNLLLQRLMDIKSNLVSNYYNQLKKRGIEPNCLSYNMLVRHLVGCGRTADAIKVLKEMERKGFMPAEGTRKCVEV